MSSPKQIDPKQIDPKHTLITREPPKRRLTPSSILLIGFGVLVFLMVIFGRKYFDLDETQVLNWFQGVRGTVWALPLTVLTFVLLAFVGAPQWVLITGAVIAFGPMSGAVYSWIATLVSASVDFWLARYLGADRLKHVGGAFINKIANLVRKNGFVTSLTVRLVPTGPFVLVNLAAGLSKMRFPAFFAGTALGIIPKIAVIALAGQSVLGTLTGQALAMILVPAILAILAILVMFYGRSRFLNRIPTKPE